jgi:hypothetical protein
MSRYLNYRSLHSVSVSNLCYCMCYCTTEHLHFRHRLLQLTVCNILGKSYTRSSFLHRLLQDTTQALAGYHTGSCRLLQRTEAATSSQAAAAPGFHYHTGSCRFPHRLLQVTTEDRGCNIFSGRSCTRFPLPHRLLQATTQALAGYHRGQRLQHLLRQQLHQVSTTLQHRFLQVSTQVLAGTCVVV